MGMKRPRLSTVCSTTFRPAATEFPWTLPDSSVTAAPSRSSFWRLKAMLEHPAAATATYDTRAGGRPLSMGTVLEALPSPTASPQLVATARQ